MDHSRAVALFAAGAALMGLGMGHVPRAYAMRKGRRVLLGLALCSFLLGVLGIALAALDVIRA